MWTSNHRRPWSTRTQSDGVASIDAGRRKPHPAIFETALDTLGVGPADTLFVGDTHPADHVDPEGSGIRAFLIDPERSERVPGSRRIAWLFGLTVASTNNH
jgi:putative hydrolase of the HAD superfamily